MGKDFRLRIGSPKEDLGINPTKENIVSVLQKLAEQVSDFENYYFLSGYLFDALCHKYAKDLSYKWYVFALNAMTYRMEVICAKLLGTYKKDVSFYNLLRFICQKQNYDEFVTKEHKSVFCSIIDSFNNKVLPVFKDIKDRRNKLNVHNDMVYMLDQEELRRLAEMTTKIYLDALHFLKTGVERLYGFYADEPIFNNDDSNEMICNCLSQMMRFVELLNNEGDLD